MKVDTAFASWAEGRGYLKLGESYTCSHGSYVFAYSGPGTTATVWNDRSNQAAVGYTVKTALVSAAWTKDVFKALKKALKGVGVLYYDRGVCTVTARAKAFQKDAVFQNLDQATQIMAETLTQYGIPPQSNCFYCGGPDCDDYIAQAGTPYPVHTGCKEQHVQQIYQEIADNRENGNLVLACIAAFVGGIVGSLPSLIAMFLGWYVGVLFAFIPLGAHWAYKKVNGVLNRATPFLISIIAIICTLVLVVMDVYIEMISYYGFFGPVELIYVILYNIDEFIIESLMPLLFCVIGIAITWRQISQDNRHRLRQAEALRNSAAAQQQYSYAGQATVQAGSQGGSGSVSPTPDQPEAEAPPVEVAAEASAGPEQE